MPQSPQPAPAGGRGFSRGLLVRVVYEGGPGRPSMRQARRERLRSALRVRSFASLRVMYGRSRQKKCLVIYRIEITAKVPETLRAELCLFLSGESHILSNRYIVVFSHFHLSLSTIRSIETRERAAHMPGRRPPRRPSSRSGSRQPTYRTTPARCLGVDSMVDSDIFECGHCGARG